MAIVKKVLFVECGVGTKEAQFFLVDTDEYDQEGLEDYAWQCAVQHAESYGIYPESDKPEDYDEEEIDWQDDQYSNDIEGWWEDYVPEEHDGYCTGYQIEPQWLEM